MVGNSLSVFRRESLLEQKDASTCDVVNKLDLAGCARDVREDIVSVNESSDSDSSPVRD